MTPPCTAPGGSGTCPKLVMAGPSLPRLVSTARMDVEPMSNPMTFAAAIRCSLFLDLEGGSEQGGVPGRERAGEEEPEHRPREHARAERNGGLAARSPTDQQRRADQSAEEEAGERADPQGAPAEPAEEEPEQAGQLDVAEA